MVDMRVKKGTESWRVQLGNVYSIACANRNCKRRVDETGNVRLSAKVSPKLVFRMPVNMMSAYAVVNLCCLPQIIFCMFTSLFWRFPVYFQGRDGRTLSVYVAPKNHMEFYTKQMSFNLKLDAERGMFLELEEESKSLTNSFRALGVFCFDIHKSSKSK